MAKRFVLPIIGSLTDGPQAVKGLEQLVLMQEEQSVEMLELSVFDDDSPHSFFVCSAHHNLEYLLCLLRKLVLEANEHPDRDYFIVAGVGWAAILPGLITAYLYHGSELEQPNIFVVPVAFKSVQEGSMAEPSFCLTQDTGSAQIARRLRTHQKRDVAALLSISQVPGNMMLEAEKMFFGSMGFENAILFTREFEPSMLDGLRARIKDIKTKQPVGMTVAEALDQFHPSK